MFFHFGVLFLMVTGCSALSLSAVTGGPKPLAIGDPSSNEEGNWSQNMTLTREERAANISIGQDQSGLPDINVLVGEKGKNKWAPVGVNVDLASLDQSQGNQRNNSSSSSDSHEKTVQTESRPAGTTRVEQNAPTQTDLPLNDTKSQHPQESNLQSTSQPVAQKRVRRHFSPKEENERGNVTETGQGKGDKGESDPTLENGSSDTRQQGPGGFPTQQQGMPGFPPQQPVFPNDPSQMTSQSVNQPSAVFPQLPGFPGAGLQQTGCSQNPTSVGPAGPGWGAAGSVSPLFPFGSVPSTGQPTWQNWQNGV